MAIRRFMYMDQTEGEAVEQADLDNMALGRMTLNNGGQAVYYLAGETLTNGDVVYASASNIVVTANNGADSTAKVLGLIDVGNASGSVVTVVIYGVMTITGASFTPGAPVFLGATGRPTSTIPADGSRVIRLGYARSATMLFVDVQDYGKKTGVYVPPAAPGLYLPIVGNFNWTVF